MIRKLTEEEIKSICKLNFDSILNPDTPINNEILIEIGNVIEKKNKILALRYYWCIMFPYNSQILFDEWDRLWRQTKISKLIELKMIDLKYDSDDNEYNIKNYSIVHHKNKTLQQYFDWKSEQLNKITESV